VSEFPANRVAGWTGGPMPVTVTDPRLSSAQSVVNARNQLRDELGRATTIAEWRCPLLRKADHTLVWVGDFVNVKKKNGTLKADGTGANGGSWRVLEPPKIDWDRKDTHGLLIANYTAELVPYP
jgi:hypothetical protein